MNDAERDAWLREALRHAPDSDAQPPSDVSEAILLKARAAARGGAPGARRVASRDADANPLLAFWAWLARPPVAAGFASVMAATLVGLMWWDQPMDETLPRRPAPTSERPATVPPPTAPAKVAAPPAPATDGVTAESAATDRAAAAKESAKKAAVDEGGVGRGTRHAPEQAGAADTRRAAPAAAPAAREVDKLAKERKNESPAPFPSTEAQRETPSPRGPAGIAASIDASKQDADRRRSRAGDESERATVPAAPRAVAPTNVPGPQAAGTAEPPAPPPAGGRLAADERRPAANAESAVTAKAKSAAGTAPIAATPTPGEATPPAATTLASPSASLGALPAAPAPAPPPAVAAAPPRDSIDAPRLQQRQGALGDLREKDVAGFGAAPASAPAPFRNELARARPAAPMRADATARAMAPAQLLAAIAADPERWQRQTAAGDTVALDAGWRAWLAELDAAAAGRWQPLGATVPPAEPAGSRDGTPTLRLVNAGRVTAIVRLDGATLHLDASPGTGADRWQATLAPAGAERVRSTARRLSP